MTAASASSPISDVDHRSVLSVNIHTYTYIYLEPSSKQCSCPPYKFSLRSLPLHDQLACFLEFFICGLGLFRIFKYIISRILGATLSRDSGDIMLFVTNQAVLATVEKLGEEHRNRVSWYCCKAVPSFFMYDCSCPTHGQSWAVKLLS